MIGCDGQVCGGAPLCPIERSARAKTVDGVTAVLFVAAESAVDAETVAELERLPASAGAVTAIEMGAAAPMPSDGSVQVTGPVPEHDQPVPPADTNATPAGSVSTTESELACDGPALATLSVYVSVAPAPTGSGDAPAVMPRSACVT